MGVFVKQKLAQYNDVIAMQGNGQWAGGWEIGLVKNPLPLFPIPNYATCVANESDFTGYARSFNNPFFFAFLNDWAGGTSIFTWGCNDSAIPQQAYGFFLHSNFGGDHILAWSVFDKPVKFTEQFDGLFLIAAIGTVDGKFSILPYES